ncbi:MAG: GIDE domain-containing protein [Cyanobacteria bacterium P01_G01_bin.54]
MVHPRYRYSWLGTVAIALLLTSCRVNENLSLALHPDYLGSACLELGNVRGRFKIHVANGDLTQHFQIAQPEQVQPHALDLGPVTAARPLEIVIRGELAAGQLEPVVRYGNCDQFAGADWRIVGIEYFNSDRVGMIRFFAGAIGIINIIVLVMQIRHLQAILSAKDYSIAELVQVLEQSPQQRYVKVRGQVKVKEPLRSPWKKVDCVYYNKRVVQKTTEGTGKTKKTKTQTLENHSRRILFQLENGANQITVIPDEAVITAGTRHQEAKPAAKGTIETSETVLPVGTTVLIVGMVAYQRNQLVLRKPEPPLKQTRFQIYRETAQTLEGNIRFAMRFSFVVAVIGSLFWLPLIVPGMADPAVLIHELTQDW